jgi:hypothetical protein
VGCGSGEVQVTIRDTDAFLRGLFDWGMLDGCWGGTRISPTDVDGLAERRRHFLIFEGKGPDGYWSRGQDIALAALQRPRSFTVIRLRGEPPLGPIYEMAVLGPHRNTNGLVAAGLDDLRNEVRDWFEWANNC